MTPPSEGNYNKDMADCFSFGDDIKILTTGLRLKENKDLSHCKVLIEAPEEASAKEKGIHLMLDELNIFKVDVTGYLK